MKNIFNKKYLKYEKKTQFLTDIGLFPIRTINKLNAMRNKMGFDKKCITPADIEKLMNEVVSWDLCDHLCKNLIVKMNAYEDFYTKWIASSHIYKKRAAYTLIAASAVHNKKLSQDTLDAYLKLIKQDSQSEHEHVKKAVSWVLRELGKRDFDYHEKRF